MFAIIFLALGFFARCYGKLYTDVAELPGNSYDFVVVGGQLTQNISSTPLITLEGGAAGSVVANRLTENPEFSVLLLEAGESNVGLLESEVPFFVLNMDSDPRYSWNYTTTPQIGLNGRVQAYSRARILGGCTSHNGMIYTRGSQDDFDRYATVSGDAGWSWDSILPYLFKNEKWVAPADHHNTNGQYNPAVHSTGGITSVSLVGYRWPASSRVIQTTKEFPMSQNHRFAHKGFRPLTVFISSYNTSRIIKSGLQYS